MRRNIVVLIAQRERRERMRTAGFRISTVVGALLILALFFLPTLLDAIHNSEQKKVAVVDPGGRVTRALASGLPEKLPNGKPAIALRPVPSAVAGAALLRGDKVDGLLVVGDLTSATPPQYRSDNPTAVADKLAAPLARLAAAARLRQAGLNGPQIAEAFSPPPLQRVDTGGPKVSDESRILVYVLVLMLYLTVLIYGANVATGIIQEKASRVTELMVAAVSALEHMAGKLFGVGLVGLVQYAVWIVTAGVVLAIKALIGSGGPDLASVGAGTFALFVLFFLLGYAFYGTLYAALSAPASRPEDGALLGQPILLTLVVGFTLSVIAIGSPDEPIVVVASLLPPFAPMVMFTRAALSSPPEWQVILSIVLLVASIVATFLALAKVYRVGLLLYGKRPTPREIVRMVRAA
ncbi:MAG TPA: ABC transporter permease [Solirubrobacteraceae bacterium]|jgi:ABC-2 type transport system permease protein